MEGSTLHAFKILLNLVYKHQGSIIFSILIQGMAL
jgi:hypothetical protein